MAGVPKMATASESKWRHSGVRVVHANELDVNTPQTPGMNRAAAVTAARAGAEKLWAGTVVIHPKAKTGAHHHGPVESVIYVVTGSARMRWGDRLEFIAEAGPGFLVQGDDRVGAMTGTLDALAKAKVNVTACDAVSAGDG